MAAQKDMKTFVTQKMKVVNTLHGRDEVLLAM
jgi:hypothetical protein